MTSRRSEIVLLFALSVLTVVSARKNFDCQVFEVDTQFTPDIVEHDHGRKWHCFPDPERAGERYEVENLSDEILDFVKGGGKWIHISGPFVNPAGKVPPGARISIAAREKNGSLDKGGRRTVRNIGRSSVLVIRASFLDSVPTYTAAQIGDSVFGDDVDQVNLLSQYDACSKGQLTFEKASGPSITEGVIDVLVQENIADHDRYSAVDAVQNVAVALVGSMDQFDHVMYCLPPGAAPINEWIAFGYYNWRRTVYNDEWCTSVSGQMHEFGHNLDLRHSGDASVAYGDQSGMMGYSYSSSESPKMCFNPAKSYQLGWFADCVTEITDPSNPTQRNLVGTADYQPNSCQQNDAVVLRVSTGADQQDLYVGYNKKTGTADGSNSGTVEAADRVTIVLGNPLEQSTIQADLGPTGDGSYTYNGILIKFCAFVNGKAVVGVSSNGADPCFECTSNADCDDGLFCTGVETCNLGTNTCEAGTPPACDDGVFCNGAETCDEATDSCTTPPAPCAGATPFCDEAADACKECASNADCDDELFCNGQEVCNAGTCEAGTPPTCDNGAFCDGAETCDEATDSCVGGQAPCAGNTPFCDEAVDACLECTSNADCDDGLFCTGVETCNLDTNTCEAGTPPACDDGVFCNGAETCDEATDSCTTPPAPCVGDTPFCDEAAGVCKTTAGGPTSTSSAPTSTAGQAPESTTQVQTTEEPEAPTTTAEDTTAAPEAPTSTPVPTTASECSWTNAGASPFSGSLDSFSMSVASGRTRVEFTSDATNTRPGVLAMYGPDSDPVESTCLTTGTLRGAFGAVSDGATNYLNNANCQWVIAPEGATAVTLVFESFDLERNYDYLKIYKCKTEVCSSNDRITLGSYTGSVLPDMHQSDAAYPYIMLHLETDYSVTQAGFRALYAGSAVAGCAPEGVQITAAVGFIQESAGAYSNSQHCTWDFGEVETTGLRLTFLDFDTEANKDFLSVKTCTTAGGPPVTTTQQAPEDPPQSTTAVPPAPLTTPGPEGDECTVFNAILGSPFSGTGSSQPPIVTANSIRVEFASDGSIVRPGFLAMYRPSADPPAYTCAQTGRLTGAWGEISDGPGEYLNNQVCEWIIESPPGSGVTLHFESFSIEDGYDMLHIDKCDDHACSNPQPLENSPFTGTSSPGLIFSDTAFLRIKMVTDFSVTKDGFKLTYTTSPISECQPDAVLANEAGFIRERAGNYVNNMQCSWEIQGSGSQIQLEFIEFSTEAGWDFVDIETCDSGTRRSGASRESHDADEARKEKIRLARLANPKQAQDSSGSNSKSKKLELKPAVEVASASAGKGRLGDQEKQERAARVRTNVMQMKAVLP